jgi:Ran GTPase-activating protein (RanGAP) involved in mRNA processing and transport
VCFDRALLLACSLDDNGLGEVGGQAVAQALQHTPNLERLK